MQYVIFDLEWNQPADRSLMVEEPVYLTGELIELGAVKLDGTFRIIDELKLYFKPIHYTRMHRRIASLTGISDKRLEEEGLPFREACGKFLDFCGEECTLMTWSMSDLPLLVDGMLLHGMDVRALPDWCDLQRIFGREIMRSDTRYSLDTALDVLKERGEKAHDALHDSRNTAKVCAHLDLEEYLDEYVGRVFAEEPLGYRYESRQALLEAPELKTFECPWCGETATCSAWLSWDHGSWIAKADCPEGDEFLVVMTPCAFRDGRWAPKRLFYELSTDLYDLWSARTEKE